MKKSLGAKAILYPTPVVVIGSYDSAGEPNVMTASWVGICCSTPPCVSVAFRPERLSYENILNRKAFTVSIPSEKHAVEADFFGMVSGKDQPKLERAGLHAVRAGSVDAPYVAEFPIVLECRLTAVHPLGCHSQFLGEIMDCRADSSVLDDRGIPDMAKVRPLLYAPESGVYYGMGSLIGKAYSLGNKISRPGR